MIPAINNLPKVDSLYVKYFETLKSSGFKGEIEYNYSSRLLGSTDNSVYQCMPNGIIFPKDASDIVIAMKLRNRAEFCSIIVTARGGGTGTNGQSLNKGIMIDCSRHMKGTSDFRLQDKEITVESGVIKDELNEFLKPQGLFFSPELSTSNRATLGGMISNDAAGQGSLKYGRTSTHIKSVKVVLCDGTLTTFGPISGEALRRKLEQQDLEGEIYRGCYALLKEKRAEVIKIFPKLNRFMTGYDLFHAYDDKTDTLNLARLICGAEGTLGIICEATLDLTKLPEFRELLVVTYENFDSALRHAVKLVDAGVLSVETVDSRVLNLARQDVVWSSVRQYISECEGHTISGINIVEFAGENAQEEHQRLLRLLREIEESARSFSGGIIGVTKVSDEEGISAVYGMRKKAVGLLGAAAGRAKLVPFTEDTVVPPRELADYILEFRALLDSMHVTYGMFGHVDCGLMHVRPALDLTTDEDRQKLIAISDGVVKLVKKYHGQMWGEHGRGYRACYGETFFRELYGVARQIKELFDSRNILNPGKICVPLSDDKGKLVAIDSLMRGDLDRTIPEQIRENFKGALSCNGNGQCFSYQDSALMCPSYRYSGKRTRSPKGYSELMRDWLRQLNDRGFNASTEELVNLTHSRNPVSFIKRAINTFFGTDDFNHEYLQELSTCLSCKSCKSICPAHVNAADLNSRFLSLYYGRYLRPRMDLLTLNAERFIPMGAKIPAISNYIQRTKAAKYILEKFFGFIDLPEFSSVSFAKLCKAEGFRVLSSGQALQSSCQILIVTDPFTVAYEAQGLISQARVMRSLGFEVQFLKPYVNGKLMVIRGDRQRFVHYASRQAARLERLHSRGLTLVGFDPALSICYRDEYSQLLGDRRGNFTVLLPEEWFAEVLKDKNVQDRCAQIRELIEKNASQEDLLPYYLFTHCTERALVASSVTAWQSTLGAFGLKVEPLMVSCCGMAGLHGHIAAYKDETYRVYERNWKKHIHSHPFEHCLITGFSCRSQVKRMEGRQALHPLAVLDRLMEKANV